MLALDRKLIRDVWHVRTQALAIALVMAAGVAMFVMSQSALVSLSGSKDSYYDRYRFADLFASAKRAPLRLIGQLSQIPGVTVVDPRIVSVVSLDIANMPEPALGKLISVPDFDQPKLNALYLKSGRWVDPSASDEVLASDTFCEEHQLNLGDRITAVLNGKRQHLQIVGIALTPEYVL